MLNIEKVDWHLLENAKEHHTDRYEIIHTEYTPVLRRSQPFRLSLIFTRPFDEAVDKISLIFKHVNQKPHPRIESVIENTDLTLSNKLNSSSTLWSLQIENQRKHILSVLIRSPPIAAWGLWSLYVKMRHVNDLNATLWQSPIKFWLLYNPWAKDDEVYMPDSKYLDEFILNDIGKVYTTSHKKPVGMKWIYGQFGASVLKVMKMILDEKDLDEVQLGSPVEFTRALIRVDNIIEGNWTGNFADGTPPWLWTGSLPIFDEYLKFSKPAKYAQCYTYAGIFTTALRAAGIPSRTITNFISATSGGDTMSVAYVYDSNGAIKGDSPSIWNFHVWNDAWMSRRDLPAGYGGWQAVDKDYGPAPLEAIKRGEICFNYDVNHIMAQCNADRVRWSSSTSGYQLVKVDTDYMGKAMLTKQPFIYDPHGDTDFMDLINCYKESEGSIEERQAVYNAVKYCKITGHSFDKEFQQLSDEEKKKIKEYFGTYPYHIDMVLDNTVKLQLKEIESINFGEQFFVMLKIENLGEQAITLDGHLGASSVYYNGATAKLIKRERKSTSIGAKSEGSLSMMIKPEEYAAKLVEFTTLNIYCTVTIKENYFTWADDFQCHVEMPAMMIKTKSDLILNKEGIILFQFKNLLKTKLTNCCITYEAPGIGRNIKVLLRDIKAGEDAVIEHKVMPLLTGEIPINAVFSSNQLSFLGGSAILYIN